MRTAAAALARHSALPAALLCLLASAPAAAQDDPAPPPAPAATPDDPTAAEAGPANAAEPDDLGWEPDQRGFSGDTAQPPPEPQAGTVDAEDDISLAAESAHPAAAAFYLLGSV